MTDLENGPNYSFLLDSMVTEEDPSIGYTFFRAVNIFYGLSAPDPPVLRSVRNPEITLSFGVHFQLHHASSPVDQPSSSSIFGSEISFEHQNHSSTNKAWRYLTKSQCIDHIH